MKTEVTHLNDWKREVLIEVPADEVAQEFDKVASEYARQASVPGFRPGRTPKSVVRLRYKDSISNEVAQRLVSHALKHAVTDHKLRVLGHPSVDDMKVEEGQALTVKAQLEVMPDFTLREYKGLAATKYLPPVTEADIDHELHHTREKHAELVPVEDRPAQDGDFASIDLVGKFLGTEQEDLKANDVEVEIGSPRIQPEFSENVRGMSVGEEKTFRVNYPADFSSKGLAGKELEYTAKLTALRTKVLPELDDEFAKGLGDFESLADLREQTRKELEIALEQQSGVRLRDNLLEKLIRLNTFEVPPSLVEQQTKSRLDSLLRELIYRRQLSPDTEIDVEAIRNHAHNLATSDVRGAMILDRIAELEEVRVNSQEIDEEISRLAERTGESFAALKSRLTKEEALDNIKDNLKNRKALDVVVANATITTETVASDASETGEGDEGSKPDEPQAEGQSEEPVSVTESAAE